MGGGSIGVSKHWRGRGVGGEGKGLSAPQCNGDDDDNK